MSRHGVFISYHDGRDDPEGGDLEYRRTFEKLFHERAQVIVSRSVQDDDIDLNENVDRVRQLIREKYLANTSVTIVLVGAKTWQRKHVDWEIGASIGDTEANRRSGLIGILLPSHPLYPKYRPDMIPPRLSDNIECGFAKFYRWTDDPAAIEQIVEEAYQRRREVLPNNSRKPFGRNWSGEAWQPGAGV
jgi:hypothetical protein